MKGSKIGVVGCMGVCLQCLTFRERTFTVCERDDYVEPPAESHRPGLVAKLNKTMYGTQDTCNAWQKLWGEHHRNNGFELGAAAAEDQIEIFGKMLQEKF